jgi:Cys-rich protein (TIGR01571 family)
MSRQSILFSPDHKTTLANFGAHPALATSFSNSITEDARYFRKQAAGIDLLTSPSQATLPAKSRRELQPQPMSPTTIAPDENPLTPMFLKSNSASSNDQPGAWPTPDAAHDDHLPGQCRHANQEIRGGTWKHGLCDCSEIGICCTGAWCPCIIYGRTQYRLSRRSERKDPTDLLGYSTFNGSCAAFAILCGCNLVLAAIQHSRVRKSYGIPGGVGTDFVRAAGCCCCTLSQDEKEIKSRESHSRRPSVSNLPMQYASPPIMQFAPMPR